MLADPQVLERADQFRELSVEYARLLPTATALQEYRRLESELESAELLRTDGDAAMRALGEEEAARLREQLASSSEALQRLLLPHDPHDEGNIFLEIRAGTGGDEAAIFAGELLRMYSRYAEGRGWQVELISENGGEHGGFREVICRVVGRGAFSRLKFESGTHRVQRVPATEAQGRIHTSACTVAILPELAAIDRIDINPADLRIDTYRSSGKGGQHVNTTDSAVRITHLPTGIVTQCQNERSQHKNKDVCMKVLRARLYELEIEKKKAESKSIEDSKLDIGFGSQIRSYVLQPYRLVKDVRTKIEVGDVDRVLNGDLEVFMKGYLQARMQQGTGKS